MTVHKFDRDAKVSYATLMREAFEAAVKLARTIERELGKERAHEILYMSRVEGDLAMIAGQMKDQPPIQNFADFKKLMKGLHENQFARNLFTITYPVDNDHERVQDDRVHTRQGLQGDGRRGPWRHNVLQARLRHHPRLL